MSLCSALSETLSQPQKSFLPALHSQYSKLSLAPFPSTYNLNYITMVKKKKWVYQNHHIVVLSLLTLLKKQDWTPTLDTTKYTYIFQDSHLNLRPQFAIQVTNGLIILALRGKKKILIS